MAEDNTNLPPGFRFFPSDEELVVHFLYCKAAHLPCQPDIIPTLDLYHCDPWELNGKALKGDNKWYFFTRRTDHRHSGDGYWMPVGDDELIRSQNTNAGIKKTLVYYMGESPAGIKTNWLMHEYHLLDTFACTSSSSSSSTSRRSSKKRSSQPRLDTNKWVICRVFDKSSGSQTSIYDEGMELSCLDEVFLSLDDYDEVSLPN
ncbi:NAC domain-containing protein 104 [Dioscorea cayenensis subsp. rotundata]|uniref:NAC domain-containing protein 104 n=1 Tax=Dioscorea cayennensis subsp. rotundata TaxID=55577 RepID=A0AB40BIC5_DIOCR|nr:NAC domain-containing protein 104 [Dioscorea cayenensis subsp. rotundata]